MTNTGARTVALRYVTRMQSGEAITSESIEADGSFPVYGGNGVRGYCERYTHDGEYVLIGRQGAHCGNIRWVSGKFWASEHAVVAKVRADCDSRYFAYLLRHHDLNQYSVAAAQPGLAVDRIRDLVIAIPSPVAQRRIADFLDRKTAAIDALIAKKEKLVALLAEQRQALITQAVTKGLDPTVPMKDSGVGWIGAIPTHWTARRIKFVCKLESGHTPSRTEPDFWTENECLIPWVSLNDTKALEVNDYIDQTAMRISERGMANSSAHLIPAGAVVFNRDGARVGLASIITRSMAVSQHIIAWVCGSSIDALYLLHAIYAMQDELVRVTSGATIPTIGMTDIKELAIPVPPLDEQEEIACHLKAARSRLDHTENNVRRQIECLRELRQAVITAAVTGKLDLSTEAAA